MSKDISIKSEAIKFYLTVHLELRAYVRRCVHCMGCPSEFTSPYGIAKGVAMPQWSAVRRALAGDEAFIDDVMAEVAGAALVADGDGFPADLVGRRRWLYVVARRTAYRMAQQHARRTGFSLETADGRDWLWNDLAGPAVTRFESPERVAQRNIDAAPLFARLKTLSPIERKLLEIATDGGDFMAFAEAAGIPAGTVRSAWCRLRKRILGWAEAEQAEDAV